VLTVTVGLILSVLCAVLVVGAGLAVSGRRRRSWQALERGMERARRLENELEELRAAVDALVERHLSPDKKPGSSTEALIALDVASCRQSEQNAVLHRRLLDAIRAEHDVQVEAQALKERVASLEATRPSRDLRVEHARVCHERDELRDRVVQLSAVLDSDPNADLQQRLDAMVRQNQQLRSELGSAQRLIHALERQLHALEEEREILQIPDDVSDAFARRAPQAGS
jgi:hypothetical protein